MKWTMLALLSAAELLGMSLWFTISAVSPQLEAAWSLSPVAAGWLTTIVQLGFVAGTALAAALNLADIVPSRRYLAASALLAAGANALVVLAPAYAVALALRFATGLFLAGVYPPAMKMIATWFRARRGLAIGTVVGALTIGKATPYLVRALRGAAWHDVVLTASAGAVAAAALVALFYRDGPEPFERRAFRWDLVAAILRDRPTRLAIGGYLGHMWELYAMWTLISAFFIDFFARHGVMSDAAAPLVGFAVIAAGGIGAVMAGAWADRFGRERITIWSMVVSGSCSLIVGWLLDAPAALVIPLAVIWGYAIVADSAQFSALVTEVAPRHAVGTALTLQTSLGFALTALSIWLAVEISTRIGWGLAFSMLAIGPVFGIASMLRLRELRSRELPPDAVEARDSQSLNRP